MRHGIEPPGWHSRLYLPHFDGGAIPQFITWRLADALPKSVLTGWELELATEPDARRKAITQKRIEAYLDSGYGACYLRDPRIAGLVEDSLRKFDAIRYDLYSWVIMPNHIHVLFSPSAGWSVSVIVGAWKSFTAKQAGRILGRAGRFWQAEYFDRYIRNKDHFRRAIEYIEVNPVRAGLCDSPEEWPYGSARHRA